MHSIMHITDKTESDMWIDIVVWDNDIVSINVSDTRGDAVAGPHAVVKKGFLSAIVKRIGD